MEQSLDIEEREGYTHYHNQCLAAWPEDKGRWEQGVCCHGGKATLSHVVKGGEIRLSLKGQKEGS